MRIFVNNVDGFLAGALCADLAKLTSDIVGTKKTGRDELIPPSVRRLVPRVDVRRFLKGIVNCRVIVYDLHDADFEEIELVIRMLQASDIMHKVTFILISSAGVWARTARGYEEVPVVEEAPEIPEGDESIPPQAEPAEGEEGQPEVPVEVPPPPEPETRPVALRCEDYIRRVPTPKFQDWKDIETQVLALKSKQGGMIRPYVVCAGIPYGNGEDAFLALFKAAWQTRSTLRVIGEGKNYIPMVHARDVARLTRHIIQVGPELDYHLAVDRGEVTQKTLIETVAKQFNLPYEPAPVTVAEAVLAEMADIFTMNIRLEPSPLMEVPWEPPPPEPEEQEVDEEEEAPKPSTSGTALVPPPVSSEGKTKKSRPNSATSQQPAPEADVLEEEEPAAEDKGKEETLPGFRWWCERGIVANIDQVAKEFSRWRRLEPVKICVVGPPGSGTSQLCHKLAEMYSIPAIVLDELIEEQRQLETPLGTQLKEQLDLIAGNVANPKSTGPYLLPAALTTQLLDAAINTAAGRHRGWVLSGCPSSMEEATALFLDLPPPAETAADPKKKAKPAEETVISEDAKVKEGFQVDMVIRVTSAEEVCSARAQAAEGKPFVEKEFQAASDLWKKDGDAVNEFFVERLGVEQLTVSADAAAEAEKEKHEDALKAAEEAEQEAPPAPDPADLVVLASGSWTWLDTAIPTVVEALEARRPVFNFLPAPGPAESAAVPADGTAAAEEATADSTAAVAQSDERLRHEQRVEHVKKEELARLEKHSEPLRLYLMKFVVPALTGALVDVCREQPEDPVGYLAEYLSLYSEVSAERRAMRAAEGKS